MLALSPFHTQHLLARWAGVSSKRVLASLPPNFAEPYRDQLQSVLDASYAVGVSEHHAHMVNVDVSAQGWCKLRGKGLAISHGMYPTIFGDCLLALTKRRIIHLSFSDNGDAEALVHDLQRRWPCARLQKNMNETKPYLHRIFSRTDNQHVLYSHLFLRGTNFQLKVWEALLGIPVGHLVTYQHIATAIGHPKAVRAVGNAVGANPVSFLIPCHRVIQSTGAIGNYRWGKVRKEAMLMWEATRCG